MSLAKFREYGRQMDDYVSSRIGEMPVTWADDSAWNAWGDTQNKLRGDWKNTLNPNQRSEYEQMQAFSDAQNKRHMNTGMGITAALIAAGAGGMGLGQLGGLEGLFGGAGEAAGGATAGAGELGGTGMLTEGGFYDLASMPFDQALSASSQLPTTSFNPLMSAGTSGAGGAGSGFLLDGGFYSPEALPTNQAMNFASNMPSVNIANQFAPAAGAGGAGSGWMLDGGFFSPEAMPFDQAAQFSANMPSANIANPFTAGATAGGGGLQSFMKGLMPSTASEGLKALSSLAGVYSGYQQNKSYGDLTKSLSSLYGPNSAYEEQLRKELQRRDAMAGRRSQYGPRAVELQARLAQLASGQAGTLGNLYAAQGGARNNMLNSALQLNKDFDILGKLGTLFGG